MKYYNINLYSRATRKTQNIGINIPDKELPKQIEIMCKSFMDEPWERCLKIELVKVTEDDN